MTAGLIPDVVKEICEKASFLLDFRSKLHYYKNGCFHISRALYYIFHENKARLKELESARIGKMHKKKIKVSREKVLENAVVNFETYGYKKVGVYNSLSLPNCVDRLYLTLNSLMKKVLD